GGRRRRSLRHNPADRARRGPGQCPRPVLRSPRPVGGHGEDGTVALYPAHPRAGRARPGARRASRPGRHGAVRTGAVLVEVLGAPGFETLLPVALRAPIIVPAPMPADPKFNFETLY